MCKLKGIALWAMVLAMVFAVGCGGGDSNTSSGGSSSSSSGGGGASSGSYAGTYNGKACSRPLTVTLSQNGTALSGSYTLQNPTFTDTFAGTLSTTAGSATVRLTSTTRNWWFDLVFTGYDSFVGGFFKEGTKVCDVDGSK